jgi:hypothetical protein
MDAQDRLWFAEYTGDKIGMFDTRGEVPGMADAELYHAYAVRAGQKRLRIRHEQHG